MDAIAEMAAGLIDADLGGSVFTRSGFLCPVEESGAEPESF